MKNVSEGYKVLFAKPITVETATDVATGVDVEKYLDDALAVLQVGDAGDAGATLDVVVLGSKDGGATYPDNLATFEQVTDADTGKNASIGFNIGEYDHVQVSWVVAGGTLPSFTFGVSVLADSPVNEGGQATGDVA